MKTIVLLIAGVLFSFGSIAQHTDSVKGTIARNLTVPEFDKMMKDHPGTVLDVRTRGEIAKGAIPGHTDIDFFDDQFAFLVEKLDKSKPVYVYCASGGRSSEAMDLLHSKGFSEVYNLEGGYSAWSKERQK